MCTMELCIVGIHPQLPKAGVISTCVLHMPLASLAYTFWFCIHMHLKDAATLQQSRDPEPALNFVELVETGLMLSYKGSTHV